MNQRNKKHKTYIGPVLPKVVQTYINSTIIHTVSLRIVKVMTDKATYPKSKIVLLLVVKKTTVSEHINKTI